MAVIRPSTASQAHEDRIDGLQEENVRITRKLGGRRCLSGPGCPNIFELKSGDYAVVGKDVTEELRPALPPDAGCAEDERIVWVPRHVLVEARLEIPAA
jgi:hypothetical protein